MNDRIKKADILIIGIFINVGSGGYWTLDGKKQGAYLEYNGKTIIRPNYEDCEYIIKNEFGLII